MQDDTDTIHNLAVQVETLRRELAEARQTIDAIRAGNVDALVVKGDSGEQIYTLINTDHLYRILLEEMNEGALSVMPDGLILFANRRFAKMVGAPLAKVIGEKIQKWLIPENQEIFNALLKSDSQEKYGKELTLLCEDGEQIPVYFSISKPTIAGHPHISCVLSTDLTEQKQIEEIVASKKAALIAIEASNLLQQSLEESIKAIASTVESRDQYTAGHMRRVGMLSMAIAGAMGLSKDTMRGIELASAIHDVGKIAIPVEILVKPGKLTNVEYMLVQTHVDAGYDIVKNIQFTWPVAEMIHQHHERMDGSGYPRGLKGDEILLGARIIAVADVVEAMSMNRPYRVVLGLDAAIEEIKQGRGRLYDPEVVDACVGLFANKKFSFT
jgi:PAS domain S-box-containing protein